VERFFRSLFESATGYLCIALLERGKGMRERYFSYPDEVKAACLFADSAQETHEVYFCAQLLDRKKRTKDAISRCSIAWADLDTCNPANLLVQPHIVVKSSPGRWQAYWRLDEPLDGYEAERLSKRIAYRHRDEGCDPSGWDLTQLLRVPGTRNHKHSGDPLVELEWEIPGSYTLQEFAEYPEVVAGISEDEPLPTDLPEYTAADLLERYSETLSNTATILFDQVPEEDWSKPLWTLILSCYEAGMGKEEVYLLVREAKCNKFARDGRPEDLWKDVCRGYVQFQENAQLAVPAAPNPTHLMSEEEYDARCTSHFVDRYIVWASSLGDAATQYHQAGGFVILSALLAGRVHLPTSFGTIKPNVWFMLLADTTLTRKSTAMDIAMDLLDLVDDNTLLATDGSIEGLLGGLAVRAGQPSIFLRDEFSGLIEQMVKKDYYAGMAEAFTKLYDGKTQKRMLRKEVIEVKDPTLIIFAGGIRNRVCSLLTHEHVSSGFIPRFIFITAESNTDRIKPMGPPTEIDQTERDRLVDEMREIAKTYQVQEEQIAVKNPTTGKMFLQIRTSGTHQAKLTEEAWVRYNQLERDMMTIALRAPSPEMYTPTYDRLCKSALRIAVLIAASMQRPLPDENVRVGLEHILAAIAYVEDWKRYTDEILAGIGVTAYEGRLQNILESIKRSPGISRSELMRKYHLTARDANTVFDTLEMRGDITKMGKKPIIYAPAGVFKK
jgi:Protein of unknown function (DUF3987)/RepB DNA-primase from phage plasmid